MKQAGFKILIVDDEPDILEFLSYNLKKEGFRKYTSSNGKSALTLAAEIKPHLILLDIMMPEMDGVETCERIRETDGIKNCIIAFLTARTEDYSQIACFEAGADDYITKPIKIKLLISRINAMLKRLSPTIIQQYDNNNKSLVEIEIDIEKLVVIIDGSQIPLPKKQFELLKLLISRPSKLFTREEIFNYLWEPQSFIGDRTLDVYIRKLREKIGEDRIKTIKGVGYKYEVK